MAEHVHRGAAARDPLRGGKGASSTALQLDERVLMVYEEGDGQTTRRLIEQSEEIESRRATIERTWLPFVWLVQLLVLWGGWQLFNIGSRTTTITKRYDPQWGLELEVGGCDVDFDIGKEPTIVYTSLLKAADYRWNYRAGDASIVELGLVRNKRGCGALWPGAGCRRVCHVVVTVPAEAAKSATFRVDQSSEDLDSPTISLLPHTRLHTLKISPRAPPRSLSLSMDRATISTELTAKFGFGDVLVTNSTLPSGASGESVYSMYLFDVSVAGGESAPVEGGGRCVVGSDAAGTDWATASRSTVDGPFSGLSSSAGEVVVTARGGNGAPRGSRGEPPTPEAPRLSHSDAVRLSQSYGTLYGDRHSTSQAIISFDIVGSASVPATRFIYTTNPFFLQLDAAILQFLTAGVLIPATFMETVHFTGFDCVVGPGSAMSPELRNATLAGMADELTKYLHSDAEGDDHPLRGMMVFAGSAPSHSPSANHLPPLWGMPPLQIFPVHGIGLHRPEPWIDEPTKEAVHTSLLLVLTVGILFGGLMTYYAVKIMQKVATDMWMRDEANTKLLYANRYYGQADVRYKQERDAAGEERRRPEGNPFKDPFRLLSKLVIWPLRKTYIDSLQTFVRESMSDVSVIVKRVGVDGEEVEVVNERFLWMRDLQKQYVNFCLENRLGIEQSRAVIQTRLISEFGAHVRSLTVNRLYGLRWKSKKEIANTTARSKKEWALPKSATPARVVRAFIAASCVVDEKEWLDLETRRGTDGEIDTGFIPALAAFAKEHGHSAPKMQSLLANSAWCKSALPAAVKPRLNMPVRQVRGLEYVAAKKVADGTWRGRRDVAAKKVETRGLSMEWYLVSALTVFFHSVVYVPPLLLAAYTMAAQNVYSTSVYVPASATAASTAHPLMWLDVYTLSFSQLARVPSNLATRVIVGEALVFMLLTIVRQLITYTGIGLASPSKAAHQQNGPKKELQALGLLPDKCLSCLHTDEETRAAWVSRLQGLAAEARDWYRELYGAAFVFQLFVMLGTAGSIGCWFLLATAMNPTTFLPYGVAAVTVATVMSTMWAQLQEAAKKFRTMLKTAFHVMVGLQLAQSESNMILKASASDVRTVDVDGGEVRGERQLTRASRSSQGEETKEAELAEEAGFDEEAAQQAGKSEAPPLESPETMARRIFALCNEDGDHELTKDEFNNMFLLLDLNLSEVQREQLFALCDVDCSGTISEEEFVKGWELMVGTFATEGAEAVGLGYFQIALTVAYTVVTLGLVIAFILVTLAAWANDDNFGAVVQSTLIGGAGMARARNRSRVRAEDPEKAEQMKQQSMEQQVANAEGVEG